MTFTANNCVRQTALRVNALVGATPAALDSTYTQAALLTAHFDSADFPFDSFKDAFVLIEGQLANAIATVAHVNPGGRLVGDHPWRPYLHAVTASVAHKGALPAATSTSKPIIGALGAAYDASDGIVCTERKPLEAISRRVDNPGTFFKVGVYWCRVEGQRVFHTRTNVVFDCCFYDGPARQAAVIASLSAPSILPDPLQEAVVCGMTSLFVRDDAFVQQAQIYRGYYADQMNLIGRGLASAPQRQAA